MGNVRGSGNFAAEIGALTECMRFTGSQEFNVNTRVCSGGNSTCLLLWSTACCYLH
jgi:hypothetical protein